MAAIHELACPACAYRRRYPCEALVGADERGVWRVMPLVGDAGPSTVEAAPAVRRLSVGAPSLCVGCGEVVFTPHHEAHRCVRCGDRRLHPLSRVVFPAGRAGILAIAVFMVAFVPLVWQLRVAAGMIAAALWFDHWARLERRQAAALAAIPCPCCRGGGLREAPVSSS